MIFTTGQVRQGSFRNHALARGLQILSAVLIGQKVRLRACSVFQWISPIVKFRWDDYHHDFILIIIDILGLSS